MAKQSLKPQDKIPHTDQKALGSLPPFDSVEVESVDDVLAELSRVLGESNE